MIARGPVLRVLMRLMGVHLVGSTYRTCTVSKYSKPAAWDSGGRGEGREEEDVAWAGSTKITHVNTTVFCYLFLPTPRILLLMRGTFEQRKYVYRMHWSTRDLAAGREALKEESLVYRILEMGRHRSRLVLFMISSLSVSRTVGCCKTCSIRGFIQGKRDVGSSGFDRGNEYYCGSTTQGRTSSLIRLVIVLSCDRTSGSPGWEMRQPR